MTHSNYKKLFAVLMTILASALILLPVFAEDDLMGLKGSGTETDVFGYYEANGWPETVSYVYLEGKELEVGMIDVSDEAVGAVLALADPSLTINIIKCDFSHSYLVETRDEIIERFTDYGITNVKLADRDDKVNVVIPGDRYQAFMMMYQSLYGAAVDYYPDGEVTTMADAMGGMGATMLVMGVLIVLFIILTIFIKKIRADKARERKLRLIQEQRLEELSKARQKQ